MRVCRTSIWPILIGINRFLREDNVPEGAKVNEKEAGTSTSGNSKKWEDQLAEKYYESLYREFAVCDLKHYKSGNVRHGLLTLSTTLRMALMLLSFKSSSPFVGVQNPKSFQELARLRAGIRDVNITSIPKPTISS